MKNSLQILPFANRFVYAYVWIDEQLDRFQIFFKKL